MGWERRDSGTGGPARASISGTHLKTLNAALDAMLESSESEVALVEVASDGDNRALTFAELRRASIGFSGRLRSLGIGRGDVVGVWLPNCLEWFVAQFAMARLGAVVLAVNTRYGAHDIADLMLIARPRLLLRPSSFNEIDFRGKFRDALLTKGPSKWGAVVGIVGPVHNDELDDWDVGSKPVPLGTALEMGKAEAADTNEPGQMSPGQMSPGQMSPGQMSSGGPRTSSTYLPRRGRQGGPNLPPIPRNRSWGTPWTSVGRSTSVPPIGLSACCPCVEYSGSAPPSRLSSRGPPLSCTRDSTPVRYSRAWYQ
jgi:hypothetical protein